MDHLLEQIAETKRRLFAEGHLNENYNNLEAFEKRYNLELFAAGAVDSYFIVSEDMVTKMEKELKKVPVDFLMLRQLLYQIKDYSNSVGANKVLNKVNQLGQLVENRNTAQSCQDALRELKLELEIFKNKMDLYSDLRMMIWDPSTDDDEAGSEDEKSSDE